MSALLFLGLFIVFCLCNDFSMKWYIVGGAVRDLLLGRWPKEHDLAFAGQASDMLRAYPQACKVGRSVEVYLLHGVECMPLRGGSLETDLRARDLTINALALEENGTVHAHPQALSDLRHKILRPASPTSFHDDPTRIYRLARFAALFPDFSVHEEALCQVREVVASGAHTRIPAERVGRELCKALCAPRPSRFLEVLAAADAFNHWFEELEGAQHIPAGPRPWHEGSVLEHLCHVMDTVAMDKRLGDELELTTWMALCHDIGKITTPQDMLPHHYAHELRGEKAASALAKRLALSARHHKAGGLAAREHMKGGIFSGLRVGTRRDILHTVHAARLDTPFWALVDADSGKPISPLARAQLEAMLAITLPPEWRDRGAESGQRLRLLQCEALSFFARD